MKTAAIIRIIVFSGIAVMLTVVLIIGIIGGKLFGRLDGSMFDSFNDEQYTVGSATFDATEINQIELNWTSGKVKVEVTDGDKFELKEDASKSLSDEDKMRYVVENGKLMVQFSASKRVWWFGFSRWNKSLTLMIPKSAADKLKDLTINAVSADVNASGVSPSEFHCKSVSGKLDLANVSAGTMTLNSTSGDMKAQGMQSDRLDMKTVSGEINYVGSSSNVNANSVSGEITTDFSNCPKSLNFNTVSGEITMMIPDNDGFSARYESVSGDFDTGSFAVTTSNKTAVYKDGGAEFRMKTVSGNISIEKK